MKTLSLRMGILGLSTIAIGLSFQIASDITKPQFNIQRKVASTVSKDEAVLTDFEKEMHDGLNKHFEDMGAPFLKNEKKVEVKKSSIIGKHTVLKNIEKEEEVKVEVEKIELEEVGKYSVLKVKDEVSELKIEEVEGKDEELEQIKTDQRVQELQSSLCKRENELDKLTSDLQEARKSLKEVLDKLERQTPIVKETQNFQLQDITAMFGQMMTTIMTGFAQQQSQMAPVVQMHNPLHDMVVQNLMYKQQPQSTSIMPEANYRVNTYNNYYGNVQQLGGQQMNNIQPQQQQTNRQGSQGQMNNQTSQRQMTPGYDWRTSEDILSQSPQVAQVPRGQVMPEANIQL